MAADLIFYQFSRDRIEALDFRHFLSAFDVEKLSRTDALRRYHGSLSIFVEGYDADPRELSTIPEVRAFFSRLHEQWRYWFFFANLAADDFRVTTACCVADITVTRRPNAPVSMEYDGQQLIRFISSSLPALNQAYGMVGFSEPQLFARTKAVFEYYGLPFDATL